MTKPISEIKAENFETLAKKKTLHTLMIAMTFLAIAVFAIAAYLDVFEIAIPCFIIAVLSYFKMLSTSHELDKLKSDGEILAQLKD